MPNTSKNSGVLHTLRPSDRFADPMQWFVVAATADADAFDIEARKNNSYLGKRSDDMSTVEMI